MNSKTVKSTKRPGTKAGTSHSPARVDGLGAVPKGAHEWVSFPDPDYERTWMFDVTFLESRWTCIYGRGCQGVLTGPAPELVQGCCSYGAHFTGAKDVRRVQAAAAKLSPQQWQSFDRARATRTRNGKLDVVVRNKAGELTTRIVKGACIFLNRPDFSAGPGCALHRAALDRGIAPLALKPDVCWQLPLRRDDEVGEGGHVTSVIRQWDRRDWGKGGREFHWWCTEEPDAFVGDKPVFVEMENELTEMVGRKIYNKLAAYLLGRASSVRAPGETRGIPVAVALPHPALRRR